jgi:hypothetical protein
VNSFEALKTTVVLQFLKEIRDESKLEAENIHI